MTAQEQLLSTQRERDQIRFRTFHCTPKDAGRGRIEGTRFPDRICGRRGADQIHSLEGKDRVSAGDGDDLVFAEDGNLDRIACGRGRDLVVADLKDQVARDCERVRRR